MTTAATIIETRELARSFKETHAVQALDLKIERGELFGLVGPDGAGKTTTLRLLAGLLDLSGGSAEVAGYDLRRQPEAIKRKIGYMAQQFSLYAELTVLENLLFFAELYDVERDQLDERVTRLLAFAGLTDFQARRAAHLSGGMQKKLALACTLIHEPEILLLDEPTTGVDPISRREFWAILTELHFEGTTIVVSTPYMDEADRCSRVGLMYDGQMVVCDQPRRIRDRLQGEVVEIRPDDWRAAVDILRGMQGVYEVQSYGEALHVVVDDGQKRLPKLVGALEKAGLTVTTARVAPARMEEAFISIIRQLEEA